MNSSAQATSRYFSAFFLPGFGLARADPQWGLVAADGVGQGDQGTDPLVHLGQQPGGAGEHAVHKPRAGCGAGQRLQEVDESVRGNEMRHHEIDRESLQVRAVANDSGTGALRAV